VAEELTAERLADQPPPAPSTGDVWRLVLADMEQRRLLGIERYGTPVQPFNGRDALTDAYQELLDLTVYLRQWLAERQALLAKVDELEATLEDEEAGHQETLRLWQESKAEVERLRAALKPFADYAERVDSFPAGVAQQDKAPAKVEWWPGMVPTLGDCRRARKTLEGKADA
jgi:hypothetical protein